MRENVSKYVKDINPDDSNQLYILTFKLSAEAFRNVEIIESQEESQREALIKEEEMDEAIYPYLKEWNKRGFGKITFYHFHLNENLKIK